MKDPFRTFKKSCEVIRLALLYYDRFRLSLRNVEDILHERGFDGGHDSIRLWNNRFSPRLGAEILRNRLKAETGLFPMVLTS